MPWPAQPGAVAALLRERAWGGTSLGPSVSWPQSLRTAIDLCLASPLPGLVWWGPELLQFHNDAALALVGARHPAALGLPARACWVREWERLSPVVERVLSTGQPVMGVQPAAEPDEAAPGCPVWCCSALRDEAGVVAGLCVTVLPGTPATWSAAGGGQGAPEVPEVPEVPETALVERRRGSTLDVVAVRAALRDSQVRFQAVAESVPDLLWRSSPDGHADWFNRRWREYTGQDDDEALGAGWIQALHPDDRPVARAHWRHARNTGKPFVHELRIRRHDGAHRWHLVRVEPLSQGEVLRWFCVATDVHEQHTARELLEQRMQQRTR